MKKFAFVFPGQGSQAVGMLDAWGTHPAVRQAVQEASDALGEDLGALIASGPKEALALTTNTQPVMLLAGVAAWRVWQAEGGALPDAVAGHSLGEYSALVAAGVLTLSQAIPLVRLRAAAMQEAVPVGTGAMAAVLGLEADKVKAVCAQVTADLGGAEVVEAVNFNDPGQTVIAGSKAAVEAAGAAMKAAGAKRALPLPVSAPFHSSLMRPAAEKLQAALTQVTFSVPHIDVINNIDVAVVQDGAAIADALYRQAFGPVRWVESIQAMKARGITHVVECGPGKVLAGMVKRIDAELVGAALYDPATLAEVKELLA
ncbi:ACP S-malonyltransferase [Comamonas nitrativorans]|uniref:Malonyl CoA-acyl carrier protein transacylase n=1 Tax=Comamonas nitrativorans TaxID=108437 RepID=A0ABV9GX53_9BURK